MKSLRNCLTVVAAVLATGAVAQDAAKGEKIFRKCAACHQVGDGAKNRVGPVLTGVVGRAAGSFEGYKYGQSMRTAGAGGLIWGPQNLGDYLSDPTRFLRAVLEDPKAKAKMKFKLKKEDERRDVIAYLATFSAPQNTEQSQQMDGGAAETVANAVCVRNRSDHEHLFAAETHGGAREVQMLKPGEMLCVEAEDAMKTGTISVFEHVEELEGCSRLVPVGRVEDMLKYVDFDRCFWGSNS